MPDKGLIDMLMCLTVTCGSCMKDFLGVFLLVILVFGSVAFFIYLGFYLNYFWWAMLQIIISVAIILFCIRYFRSHRVK